MNQEEFNKFIETLRPIIMSIIQEGKDFTVLDLLTQVFKVVKKGETFESDYDLFTAGALSYVIISEYLAVNMVLNRLNTTGKVAES